MKTRLFLSRIFPKLNQKTYLTSINHTKHYKLQITYIIYLTIINQYKLAHIINFTDSQSQLNNQSIINKYHKLNFANLYIDFWFSVQTKELLPAARRVATETGDLLLTSLRS